MNYVLEEYFKDFETFFPNVTLFAYHDCNWIPEMCATLWKMNWDRLTTVEFCSLQMNFDVESVFFGLTQQERDYIDEQALNCTEYHHIYSNYSAFNLNSLKKIQLQMEYCQAFVPSEEVTDYAQEFPIISGKTAQKISNEFDGLDLEVMVECANLENHRLPICEDANYRTQVDPQIYKTACPHKRRNPHRNSHHYVDKYKFNVRF